MAGIFLCVVLIPNATILLWYANLNVRRCGKGVKGVEKA